MKKRKRLTIDEKYDRWERSWLKPTDQLTGYELQCRVAIAYLDGYAAGRRSVKKETRSDHIRTNLMSTIIDQVIVEVSRATSKFPTWPTDPLHALAVLGEEYGELTKAMLQFTYEKHKGVTREDIREEAIQTAAMALRLAMSLSMYDYAPAQQHKQGSPYAAIEAKPHPPQGNADN